mmetsp:Transcript_23825/g.27453  ORF Transcript_23825/g.27453 Transcript_23825/m.27453 type:complete len:83 (-) Transcript_23825:1128-1376(-)
MHDPSFWSRLSSYPKKILRFCLSVCQNLFLKWSWLGACMWSPNYQASLFSNVLLSLFVMFGSFIQVQIPSRQRKKNTKVVEY